MRLTGQYLRAADEAAAAGDFQAAAQSLDQHLAGAPDDQESWVKYSAMLRATGRLNKALAAAERALSLSPLDFTALLAKAFLLERLGRLEAGEAFTYAVAQAPDDDQLPPALQQAVRHAKVQASTYWLELQQKLCRALPADIDRRVQHRAERFISNASHLTKVYPQQPSHYHYPDLPAIEVHDTAQFAGLRELEADTDAIRAEFVALLEDREAELAPYIQYEEGIPLRQWEALNRNDAWSAFHLLKCGERVARNADRCPATMAALARLDQPQVAKASPNAMFSLLAPRTRIPPHTGVANTRLVCHLPLIVPGGCGFRVGATTLAWEPGRCFVFDDTIEHEAWNDSDELRVVLICDLWPPAMTADDRRAAARVIEASGGLATATL